jgi:hypothetical protein
VAAFAVGVNSLLFRWERRILRLSGKVAFGAMHGIPPIALSTLGGQRRAAGAVEIGPRAGVGAAGDAAHHHRAFGPA